MLQFALAYRTPLDGLTGIREMKLRSYELSEEEWKIAGQLAGVLDVSYFYSHDIIHFLTSTLDFQTGDAFLLCPNS
jgi:hypothetical protein